jgi:hypothetical protein
MQLKSSLTNGVGLAALLSMGLVGAAGAETYKHHKTVIHKVAGPTAAEIATSQAIDKLTGEVEDLKARLDAEAAARTEAQTQVTQAQAQAAQAMADAKAARDQLAEQIQTIPGDVQVEVAKNKPKTDKLYVHGVSVTLGGFAAMEGAWRSHDETADIGSSYAKIPYPNDPAGRTSELFGSARQSRVSALVQGDVNPDTHAFFYGEFDFLGAAQTANSNESNSYQPRVRNLYGALDLDNLGLHFLAGQSWSLLTLNKTGIMPRTEMPPPTIDAQYVPGFTWARQPQLRIVKDFNKQFWIALSVENPQTTLSGTSTPTGVTATINQAPTSQFYSGTNYSLNHVPDVIGKVAFDDNLDGHAIHLEAFGLWRDFYDRVSIASPNAGDFVPGSNNYDTSGGGGGVSAALTLVPKYIDVQGSVMTGVGIGRYGSAQLPDATVQANGRLAGIPETMWLAGVTFHPTTMLDVYVFGGQEAERTKTFSLGSSLYGFGVPVATDAGCIIQGGACAALTRSIDQVTAGFWQKIYSGSFGRVQFGMQYSHTEKDAFADASGFAPDAREDMVLTSFRYYPF